MSQNAIWAQFGFNLHRNSSHTARTMMLHELTLLLDWVHDPVVPREGYLQAIVTENCLRKASVSNRKISARHLIELYSLDPTTTIFRALRFLWSRDVAARPILALLCALSRDSILNGISQKVADLPVNAVITREDTEYWINEFEPGRFSAVTLSSMAKNINSTWTQAGYLKGKVTKTRIKSLPSSGAVVYALFLAHLGGVRGLELFQTHYLHLLDCTTLEAIERAKEASQRGWIIFRQVENVIDISFPTLLNRQEMEWLREQN